MIKEFNKILISNKKFQDLNPLDFGKLSISDGYSQKQCQPMYYMYYIISGNLCLKISDTQKKYNSRNNLFVVPPNTKYKWSCPDGDSCSILWVGFSGALSEKLAELIPDEFQYQGKVFSELYDVGRFSEKEAYIAGKLFQLYSELSQQNTSKTQNYINEIKYNIASSFNSFDFSIDRIADKIGIDRRYMSRIFKQHEGITPKEYLINVRLSYSAYMIRLGYSLKEVAQKCGYVDSHYFSTAFKKQYGISPSKYQKSPTKAVHINELIPENFDWRISKRN